MSQLGLTALASNVAKLRSSHLRDVFMNILPVWFGVQCPEERLTVVILNRVLMVLDSSFPGLPVALGVHNIAMPV